MHERGHVIGLHYALNGLTDMQEVRHQIKKEMDILSEMFGFPITQFSVHRPSPDVLRENIKLPGILNAYQDEFFTFAEKVTDQTPLKVKYLSDANHIWRYGYPDEANITGYDKVQILTHPFAWSKKGYDNRDNYAVLIQEKYKFIFNAIYNRFTHDIFARSNAANRIMPSPAYPLRSPVATGAFPISKSGICFKVISTLSCIGSCK